MIDLWNRLRTAYEGLVIRERILVFVGVLAVLYGACNSLLLHPLDIDRTRVREALKRTRDLTIQLNQRAELLVGESEGSYLENIVQEREHLQHQLSALDDRIELGMASMVPPEKVTQMLEELLAEESDLELLSLRTLNRSALDLRGSDRPGARDGVRRSRSSDRDRDMFYRHEFVIELEGTYLATLRYLESIERLPWQLSWDRLEFRVIDHPRAHLSIELHTLSSQEDWIGV